MTFTHFERVFVKENPVATCIDFFVAGIYNLSIDPVIYYFLFIEGIQ